MRSSHTLGRRRSRHAPQSASALTGSGSSAHPQSMCSRSTVSATSSTSCPYVRRDDVGVTRRVVPRELGEAGATGGERHAVVRQLVDHRVARSTVVVSDGLPRFHRRIVGLGGELPGPRVRVQIGGVGEREDQHPETDAPGRKRPADTIPGGQDDDRCDQDGHRHRRVQQPLRPGEVGGPDDATRREGRQVTGGPRSIVGEEREADGREHEQHEPHLVAAPRRHGDVGEPRRERRHPDGRHRRSVTAQSPSEGGHDEQQRRAGDQRGGHHRPVRIVEEAVEAPEDGWVQRWEVELRAPLAPEPVAAPEALARSQVGAGVIGDDVIAHRQRDSDDQTDQHRQGDPFPVSQPPHEGADARDPGHLAAQGSQPRGSGAKRRGSGETSSSQVRALRWPTIGTSAARRRPPRRRPCPWPSTTPPSLSIAVPLRTAPRAR